MLQGDKLRRKWRETIVMRTTDLARLNEPYPEGVGPTDADVTAPIGVRLPHWTMLENEIFSDFMEEPPYGIGEDFVF